MMTIRNSRSPLSPVPLRQTLNGFMDLWDLLGTTNTVAQAAEARVLCRFCQQKLWLYCSFIGKSWLWSCGCVATELYIEVQYSVNSPAGSKQDICQKESIKPKKRRSLLIQLPKIYHNALHLNSFVVSWLDSSHQANCISRQVSRDSAWIQDAESAAIIKPHQELGRRSSSLDMTSSKSCVHCQALAQNPWP